MDQVYISQESKRLSQIMYDDPHAAAEELREELRTIPPDAAVALIRQTKVEETNYGTGGLGDLQIQVELDQRGCDSGYRNVIIATPEGPEQIAEFQSGAPICYNDQVNYNQSYRPDPLASITTMIIGNYLWQQQHNLLRDDTYYHGWHHRQQSRENHWQNHHGEWQNWQNQDFRRNIQQQDWQQFAWQPRWYHGQDNVQKYYHQQPKQYYPQDVRDHRHRQGLPTPEGEWHRHGHHRRSEGNQYWRQDQGAGTYYSDQNQTRLDNLQKQQEALRLQKQEQDRLLRQQQGLIPGNQDYQNVPSNKQGNQYWRQQGNHGHDLGNHSGLEDNSGHRKENHRQHQVAKDVQDQRASQQQLLQQRQIEQQQQKEAARQQQQLELLKQKQQEVLQRQQEEAAKRQEQHDFSQQQLLRQKQQEALQQQQLRQQQEAAKQELQERKPEPLNPQLNQPDEQQQATPSNNAHRYQGGRHGLKM